jgi:hypothetical protein
VQSNFIVKLGDNTMLIRIRDSKEFGQLLEALADEIVIAFIHFRLYSDLKSDVNNYVTELNQSPAFWSFTFRAHIDTVLSRLCRVYEQHSSSLNLKNFLNTILANINIFDVEHFRERLKDNPFVDSLSSSPTKPDIGQLKKDIHYVSDANPSVKTLLIWRNNIIVHKSAKHANKDFNLPNDYPLSLNNIEQLLKEGMVILNRYSNLFHATTYSTKIVSHDDYRNVLDAIRTVISQSKEKRALELELFCKKDS